jgi:hypothetical protein
MSLCIAAFSMYVGAAFRRGAALTARVRFKVPATIAFLGVLGALWGPLPFWAALIPALFVGLVAGVVARRLSEPDVLETTAYLGKSRPN